ncbi:MAG: hypothetical protein WCA36_18765 [Pseudolabrys sp.]
MDRKQEHRQPGGNAADRSQQLPAMTARPVNTGGTARRDQGGVELGGIGIAAGERETRAHCLCLERKNVPLPASTLLPL